MQVNCSTFIIIYRRTIIRVTILFYSDHYYNKQVHMHTSNDEYPIKELCIPACSKNLHRKNISFHQLLRTELNYTYVYYIL